MFDVAVSSSIRVYFRIIFPALRPLRNMSLLWLACGLLLASADSLEAQDESELARVPAATTAGHLDVELLKQLESRVLPPAIVPGAPRFADLPAYYWAENQELQKRLELARHHYESPAGNPYRALTLIGGTAGVGKTFIKRDIFSQDYPAEAICKFDVRELFEQWKSDGLVEDRPDLHCDDVVLNTLPAIKPNQPQLMLQFLESQSASFFVIDSLDEVHPDNYLPLMKQIEEFVLHSDRDFLHVVVLGRTLAFRDYWHASQEVASAGEVAIFMLHPPRFVTTGDLMVSSWNYHTWRYQLRWQTLDGEPEVMPLDVYAQWVESGYPDSILDHRVLYEPNNNMNSTVEATIESWARQHPIINSMLCNLAGNGIIREIAERFALEQRDFDERAVMEAYLEMWLERDTKCEDRPSCAKPEHLDLYMRLVKGVAARYLAQGQVNSSGFFPVRDDDLIEVMYEGRPMSFRAQRILDRSGLKYLDPTQPGTASYRFEPFWFHRLLVEKHNDMLRDVVNR